MARLLFFIQHRLVQLQWTRDTLAAAGGPSPSTLRKAQREDRELAGRTFDKSHPQKLPPDCLPAPAFQFPADPVSR